ncbi:MAG: hypothetical protein IT453_22625 [Planctomycetes bacterium]|nr:hypothetical protein [Planctomycetota bacterium]
MDCRATSRRAEPRDDPVRSATLNGTALAAGDGASTEDAGTLVLAASEPLEALLFDLG